MPAPTVEQAIRLKLAESEFLDFKRDAYSEGKEWAKDVTAFANGSGGRIIIGVEEDSDGRAHAAVGVHTASIDTHIQQLESWMRDLTEPDVTPAVRLRTESDNAARTFIVVDIQESSQAPHRITAKGGMQNHVYMRKARRNVTLSMDEIRDVVLDTFRTPKLITDFIADRHTRLQNANPLRESPGRYVVFHVCPRKGFGNRRLVDWSLTDGQDRLPEDNYWSRTRPNTFGAFSAYTSENMVVDPAYHQVFYNGCAELLYTGLLHATGDEGDSDRRIVVAGPRIKQYVRSNLAGVITLCFEATGCDEFEVGTRYSMLAYKLAWQVNGYPRETRTTPDQHEFSLPNVLVRIGADGRPLTEDLDEVLHLTWRAWGEMRCPIT